MNIIVFRDGTKTPLRLNLSRRFLLGSAVATLAVMVAGLGGLGYLLGGEFGWKQRHAAAQLTDLQAELEQQREIIASLGQSNERHVDALALRLGEMKARTIRLEALGERLTRLGQLDDGEFDFAEPPALGGPGVAADLDLERLDLNTELSNLGLRMDHQEQQLRVLETLIANRELDADLQPAGRPIAKGWLSSHFGNRADPFTGAPDYHPGIDFTGPPETDILAVASGVVIWSGVKPDYGNCVDIDHGNGYVTRYAHNKVNAVDVGDRVQAGQVIATMGDTGRATSRHVHFEVWYEGRRINPHDVVTAGR